MRESAKDIDGLRQCLARIEGRRVGDPAALFTTGHDRLDAAIGGGLARGRMHEICAGDAEGASCAAAFAALLALRASAPGAPLMWLRTEDAERRSGRLYAPGLVEMGFDPGALVLGVAPDDTALLKCAGDAARCAGLGAIIVECWRNPRALDLTASRRLVLAAERSGVTLLLLRVDAAPMHNAADTRWRVQSAPSAALAAEAPGQPLFEIELLRRRAGPAGMTWRMEWNRDEHQFREPALPGAVVPVPGGGALAHPSAGTLRRRA